MPIFLALYAALSLVSWTPDLIRLAMKSIQDKPVVVFHSETNADGLDKAVRARFSESNNRLIYDSHVCETKGGRAECEIIAYRWVGSGTSRYGVICQTEGEKTQCLEPFSR